MTPLPKHLEEMRDDESTAFEFCTGPVGYRNGFNQAASILLKDMESMAKALEKYASREFWSYGGYNKYGNSIAIEALKIWREKYGGKK